MLHKFKAVISTLGIIALLLTTFSAVSFADRGEREYRKDSNKSRSYERSGRYDRSDRSDRSDRDDDDDDVTAPTPMPPVAAPPVAAPPVVVEPPVAAPPVVEPPVVAAPGCRAPGCPAPGCPAPGCPAPGPRWFGALRRQLLRVPRPIQQRQERAFEPPERPRQPDPSRAGSYQRPVIDSTTVNGPPCGEGRYLESSNVIKVPALSGRRLCLGGDTTRAQHHPKGANPSKSKRWAIAYVFKNSFKSSDNLSG